MNFQSLLPMSCLIVICATTITIIFYLVVLLSFLFCNWQDIRSTKPIWKNEYPSFEELHALIDRGDIMLSTVLTASTLQLSHPGLSKTLRAHSTYQSDPWRRVIRTTAFIYIMTRATSSERDAIITWLQKLHRPIPLFVFETNVLVFATFAYGLVKTHEFLGNITPKQVDGIIKSVMLMADKLDPNDKGRRVPCTLAEVEEYLRKELSFDVDELLQINKEQIQLASVRREMEKQGVGKFLRRPWTLLKLMLFQTFVERLSNNVLAQDDRRRGVPQQLLWWYVRKIHCFLSFFHYSMCPQTLTFDGTLELLVTGNPRMKHVPRELYREIFGSEGGGTPLDVSPDKALRTFSDIEAHLPSMEIDKQPTPLVAGFQEEVVELVKCSYYRGKLDENDGAPLQHLGVIMDGNRRYSRHTEMGSVLSGHQVGARKLLQVISWTFSCGIQNLTVWALSDDNLKRLPQELDSLFFLMAEYIREIGMGNAPFSIPDFRFRVVGDRSVLPDYLQQIIVEAETATAHNTKFNFQIALGYGGRSEVTRAVKLAASARMTQKGLSLEAAIEGLTEVDITRETYSAQLGLPEIDTILRTSGENRLSGFALWESYHAEFLIIKENWPALRQSIFLRSLLDFSKRNRRFGA